MNRRGILPQIENLAKVATVSRPRQYYLFSAHFGSTGVPQPATAVFDGGRPCFWPAIPLQTEAFSDRSLPVHSAAMLPRRSVCCAAMILFAAISLTTASNGQVIPAIATTGVPPAFAPTDIRHLEIGDSYRVSVSRKGLTKQYDGKLVKAN